MASGCPHKKVGDFTYNCSSLATLKSYGFWRFERHTILKITLARRLFIVRAWEWYHFVEQENSTSKASQHFLIFLHDFRLATLKLGVYAKNLSFSPITPRLLEIAR